METGTGYSPGSANSVLCSNNQEIEKLIRLFEQRIASELKKTEELPPSSNEYASAKTQLAHFQEHRLSQIQILKEMGICRIPGCNKHLVLEELSDTDAVSGTDVDPVQSDGKSKRPPTPPATNDKMEVDFQVVSPRRAARRPSQAVNTLPITTANRFEKLDDTPAPRESREFPATINLKPRDNYSSLLKEISEKFPGTTNKFLYGYINIQAVSDENRLQIMQLLVEKKEEFILLEATKDRPLKVVLKGLQASTDTTAIIEDLRDKGFTINRISPMRNYKMQKPLDMFLIETKKVGNYQNIYNVKEIGYVVVKIEPYRKKNKATICFNCSGFHHSARNCHQKPRCIKCNGEHPTRECKITEKIENPVCINCGEKGHLAAWRGCKALPVLRKPSIRIPGKSFAEAASQGLRKDPPSATHGKTGTSQEPLPEISDIKETLLALKELKEFLQEFPTLLEAAKKCKAARSREEKLLIVLNALTEK
ncbi:Nucleic-acid-binding protein from transposon X-element [Araneus ventricosus]|uniref:Nucleic-acid-binding protein from transposon X-element n=1 Tax=Araneus ventricosus TaxID=182803 RepID=A0A4Y2IGC8_ARAVE|nr:Nucleic-acid-binding protein from transposon X-element [Araneus ventricosus]